MDAETQRSLNELQRAVGRVEGAQTQILAELRTYRSEQFAFLQDGAEKFAQLIERSNKIEDRIEALEASGVDVARLERKSRFLNVGNNTSTWAGIVTLVSSVVAFITGHLDIKIH